jgi:hypothetical protein
MINYLKNQLVLNLTRYDKANLSNPQLLINLFDSTDFLSVYLEKTAKYYLLPDFSCFQGEKRNYLQRHCKQIRVTDMA